MKIIAPRIHGYLDYITVFIFLAAPTFLSLKGLPMILSYSLSGIHLSLTVLTNFPLGILKVISFPIHGKVEFVVGLVMPTIPFLLKFEGVAFAFYLTMGLLIFVLDLMTIYKEK